MGNGRYVVSTAAGSFLDKKTGARDLGFGTHIMDFLMAPGRRADGYERDPKLHGNLPKHYVEARQICTKAGELPVEVIRGDGFVAVRMAYTFHEPGRGYEASSTWEQTKLRFASQPFHWTTTKSTTKRNPITSDFLNTPSLKWLWINSS